MGPTLLFFEQRGPTTGLRDPQKPGRAVEMS